MNRIGKFEESYRITATIGDEMSITLKRDNGPSCIIDIRTMREGIAQEVMSVPGAFSIEQIRRALSKGIRVLLRNRPIHDAADCIEEELIAALDAS